VITITDKIEFIEAFKYPFKEPKRLLYILWIFLPIIGWFALSGYFVRIVNEQIKGKYAGLPKLYFMEDLKLGFMMFLKALPFALVYGIFIGAMLYFNEELAYILNLLLSFFVLPLLALNFYKKQTIESYFELSILKHAFGNFGAYLLAIIKQYALFFVFLILCFLLVGFPALYVTNSIFLANFYGRYVEKEALRTRDEKPYEVI